MKHSQHGNGNFLDEQEIDRLLSQQKPLTLGKERLLAEGKQSGQFDLWYDPRKHTQHDIVYDHHEEIRIKDQTADNKGAGKQMAENHPCYTCNTLTDKWVEWLLTTPKPANPFANPSVSSMNAYSDTNAFLFGDENCNTYAYFTTVSPFQKPDFRRIVMTKQVPLLVPVYNVVSSPQMFPSRAGFSDKQWVEQDIIKDLGGIYHDGIRASFDGEEFYGCSVIRRRPLKISNIPKDNVVGVPEDILRTNHSTIQIYHGGLWLLIRETKFTPGDHLLSFEAQSVNYEIKAKIMITALV